MSPWVPFVVLFAIALGFGTVTILISNFFGPRVRSSRKDMPYECGMEPVGDARLRFSIKFYLITMLFILFDMEAVFIYPWAVIYSDMARLPSMGLFIFVEMAIYLGIVFTGFLYVWKKGALNWD